MELLSSAWPMDFLKIPFWNGFLIGNFVFLAVEDGALEALF